MAPFKNIREHVLHASFGEYTGFRGHSTTGNLQRNLQMNLQMRTVGISQISTRSC